jgi:hypothetical protein
MRDVYRLNLNSKFTHPAFLGFFISLMVDYLLKA